MIIYMVMAHELDEPQQHSILRQYQNSFFKDVQKTPTSGKFQILLTNIFLSSPFFNLA